MRLFIDLEVYSEIDIKKAPLDVYANHESTKIIMASYRPEPWFSFDPKTTETSVWCVDESPKAPECLRDALRDPSIDVVAWNINFERTILKAKGLDIPIIRWIDAMAHARYVGLPGSLKACAKIPLLGVPEEAATKSETLLINKFCKPNKDGKRNLGTDPKHAEDWKKFVEYCRRDTDTTRHILNYLERTFPFPASERVIWELDQLINERGLPIDLNMARNGERETNRLVASAKAELGRISGLENGNSVQQLLPWLQAGGYPYDSLGKEFIQQAIELPVRSADDEEFEQKWGHIPGNVLKPKGVSKQVMEALQLRSVSSKSSVKKFAALVKETSPDSRLRQQFKYYGAHTGRWAGRGVQPQNLTRQAADPLTLQALQEVGAS